MSEFRIPSEWLTRSVRVALVGCGGNGSQMLTGLARLHVALLAKGHPYGLQVTAFDFDRVSSANVGRQMFYPSDTGHFKAHVLVHRVNCAFGLDWRAVAGHFPPVTLHHSFDLVIGCVDTAKARRLIGASHYTRYWLDLGNSKRTGQVVFGKVLTPDERQHIGRGKKTDVAILPTVLDLFPELQLEDYEEEDTPSCSLAEALDKQDLFINDHVSRWALHLLWVLFSSGRIAHHGYFINVEDGRVNPIPVAKTGYEVPHGRNGDGDSATALARAVVGGVDVGAGRAEERE